MSLRVCLGCSTAYAVGIQACPQCGTPTRNAIYDWEDDVVAKASAEGGATFYLPEGQPVPDDLPDGVRLVGPGTPQDAPETPADRGIVGEHGPELVTLPGAGEVPAPPPVSAPKAEWVEHAAAVLDVPAEEAAALTKAELVETVKAAAVEPPPPPSTPEPSSPESSAPDEADADES